MIRALTALIALALAVSAWAGEILTSTNPVADHYIVVLQDDPSDGLRVNHNERRQQVIDQTEDLLMTYRTRADWVYTDTIGGFSARLDLRTAQALARDPRVAYIIQDTWVEAAAPDVQFDPPSWGLDRIDQRDPTLDQTYQHWSSAGTTPVHVYVLDSGIRSTHQDFAGRVDTLNSFTVYTDGHGINDCHGHGTHVAGIIGGDLHGVAKHVTLHTVRVLNCWAGGPISAVIAGVDWVTARVNDEPQTAVANMSLVAAASQALDDAVRASIAAGVTYVVAAGNNNADACNYSPARVTEAITVGASTADDQRVSNSNHGDCVDLYAPGAGIRSTYNRSDTDTISMTGTSAAAPHVAGIAALLLAQGGPAAPADIADLIIANATQTGTGFLPDANDLLAFGLIELDGGDPEPGPVPRARFGDPVVNFSHRCQANRSCSFEAGTVNNATPILGYHWDFGDGNTLSHTRPAARHRYQVGGTVTVTLTIEFFNGQLHAAQYQVTLP